MQSFLNETLTVWVFVMIVTVYESVHQNDIGHVGNRRWNRWQPIHRWAPVVQMQCYPTQYPTFQSPPPTRTPGHVQTSAQMAHWPVWQCVVRGGSEALCSLLRAGPRRCPHACLMLLWSSLGSVLGLVGGGGFRSLPCQVTAASVLIGWPMIILVVFFKRRESDS